MLSASCAWSLRSFPGSTPTLGWRSVPSAQLAPLESRWPLRQSRLQLRHSNRVRLDQSRPYVLVTLDQSPITFASIDFHIQNAGAGPAYNVRTVVDPRLQRADEVEDMPVAGAAFFNETIPMMAPGYDLRSHFDTMVARHGSGIPNKYTFTVTYDDGHGHDWTESTVQDLDLLNDMLFAEQYGVHHVAKALREIKQTLERSKLLKKGELDAIVETRGEREARAAEYWAEQERHRAASEVQRNNPSEDGDG